MYEGCLPDGTLVAVKRLTKKGETEDEERTADFLSELGIIAHVDHPNSARLVGFGVEGGLYLVLQFARNGSVESCLQGANLHSPMTQFYSHYQYTYFSGKQYFI